MTDKNNVVYLHTARDKDSPAKRRMEEWRVGTEITDISDRVLLHPYVITAWLDACQQALRSMIKEGVDMTNMELHIADEKIMQGTEDTLWIYVDMPTGHSISMQIPQDKWAWKT